MLVMFTREEASRIKQEFWTVFGKYMSPVPSAEGEKVGWINYHTQVKDVYFRMDAGLKSASIYISLEQPNDAIRELYFEQLLQSKKMLHAALGEEWDWKRDVLSEGKTVSRISKTLPDVSVMNKDHWPDLISFFKPRIIALDAFWENAKYAFDGLK
uniref:DUF4268 domain-containing protein n=1 Tax=uncultured bacterium BLR19 TaxID=506519 RepID=C0INZ2_9BACT|nr:hypothetical protein AKSOIL_0320 [uncultured bacterium BLR19]